MGQPEIQSVPQKTVWHRAERFCFFRLPLGVEPDGSLKGLQAAKGSLKIRFQAAFYNNAASCALP